eukprot:SAG31_NODE_4289_length_3376_cov_1044.267928_3_plen_207_part_00
MDDGRVCRLTLGKWLPILLVSNMGYMSPASFASLGCHACVFRSWQMIQIASDRARHRSVSGMRSRSRTASERMRICDAHHQAVEELLSAIDTTFGRVIWTSYCAVQVSKQAWSVTRTGLMMLAALTVCLVTFKALSQPCQVVFNCLLTVQATWGLFFVATVLNVFGVEVRFFQLRNKCNELINCAIVVANICRPRRRMGCKVETAV